MTLRTLALMLVPVSHPMWPAESHNALLTRAAQLRNAKREKVLRLLFDVLVQNDGNKKQVLQQKHLLRAINAFGLAEDQSSFEELGRVKRILNIAETDDGDVHVSKQHWTQAMLLSFRSLSDRDFEFHVQELRNVLAKWDLAEGQRLSGSGTSGLKFANRLQHQFKRKKLRIVPECEHRCSHTTMLSPTGAASLASELRLAMSNDEFEA
ncbi:MAG: hypothetical protein MHM6MM_001327 [Cercozoa sp. M6MM]